MFQELALAISLNFSSIDKTSVVLPYKIARSSGKSSSGGTRSSRSIFSSHSSSSSSSSSSTSSGTRSARSIFQPNSSGPISSNPSRSASYQRSTYNSRVTPHTTINRTEVSHTYYHQPYMYNGGYNGMTNLLVTMMVMDAMTHQYQPQVVVVQPGQQVPANAQILQGAPAQVPQNAYSMGPNGDLIPYTNTTVAQPQSHGNPFMNFFGWWAGLIGWIVVLAFFATIGCWIFLFIKACLAGRNVT